MYDQQVAKRILKRLTEIRTGLLREYPFFGSLLMHLSFGIANCTTAFTDMRRIVFDPDFVDELDDDQLTFVMLHEVLHCVLNHCYRGRDFQHLVFNIACDIVVNSSIMQVMGLTDFEVAGENAMHLTPLGDEGYRYTAEQVYEMLLKKLDSMQEKSKKGKDSAKGDSLAGAWSENTLDNHEPWKNLPANTPVQDEWRKIVIQEASKSAGNASLPPCIRELLKDLDYKSKVNWKVLLREFIEQNYDEFDYTYNPPDRRYLEYDMYLQSFRVQETERVENIWFCVDTSGSISDAVLNMIYAEIKQAVYQWRGLSGKVSFFDTTVTEPKEFASVSDLDGIHATGGGGTSFHAIFNYMEQEMNSNLPRGIVILTDGYASFPEEQAAFGVPVLWLIVDSKIEAPWGTSVQIQS